VVITLALRDRDSLRNFPYLRWTRPPAFPRAASQPRGYPGQHFARHSLDRFSYREYLDIRDTTKSYAGVIVSADMEAVGFSAEPGATPRVKGGMMVSGNYFQELQHC
jgi:hypothetical protein